MARGRKPTPTKLKVLRGNPGKRPLSKDEPQPPTGDMDPPEWFDEIARQKWEHVYPILTDMKVLTQADYDVLCAYCDTYSKWLKATKFIRENGVSIEAVNIKGDIVYKRRVEVDIESDCGKRLRMLMSELGLTPATRPKLKVNAPDQKGNKFREFLERGKKTS